ncbi:hypothetical protein BBOV_I002670 [Babesia bovis T2Bo]|uniref:hypothetical protein n=1 Tax=Babesia bovis T2Bo TaxID=484906 RepID=UPI001C356AC8|nr:hypothetical protein BBOV_I002670 [Babesia bovis T2Bo]EDO05349.2 hypothetical protein BBOV_I002670 [Babesia bovis T2Bo]
MKRQKKSIWAILGAKCLGGCLRSEECKDLDTEVVNPEKEMDPLLHLRDYTSGNANLIPILPQEIEFRRVENFHCRSLTIVDQSPIAVRSLDDMTKELSTVKEPTAVILPPKLPFDLVDEHPSFETDASESDDDVDESLQIKRQEELHETCYKLADQIYQMERSKIGIKNAIGNCDTKITTKTVQIDTNKSNCNNDSSDMTPAYRDCVSYLQTPWEELKSWEESVAESVEQDNREQNVKNNKRPPLWMSLATTKEKRTRNNSKETHQECDRISTDSSRHDDENKSTETKLHNISAIKTPASMVFFDPFEEEEETQFWPFNVGAGVWKYIIGGSQSHITPESLDINVEGCITSFYSKEELREMRRGTENMTKAEGSAIVEYTLTMINK